MIEITIIEIVLFILTGIAFYLIVCYGFGEPASKSTQEMEKKVKETIKLLNERQGFTYPKDLSKDISDCYNANIKTNSIEASPKTAKAFTKGFEEAVKLYLK